MSQRLRRLLTSLTSSSAKGCSSGPECKCCAAIRRAREAALFDPLPEYCSPLTPGVQLVNLSHSEDGRNLQVELGNDWPRMFAGLPLAGEGLVMTRNEAAILGRNMKYPALSVTSGGSKGASGEGGLWLNFRGFGSARALHQRRETGHLLGVELADEMGRMVHRFTLTAQSDMDEFFAWVRLHQACSANEPTVWTEMSEAPALDLGNTVRHCDGDALVSVVAACVDRALPLRATVRGEAVTQRAEFTPRALQPSDEWWFASDDATGLHFQPELFASVAVELQVRDNGETCVAVRAVGEDNATALILESGSVVAEDAWRTLLEATA